MSFDTVKELFFLAPKREERWVGFGVEPALFSTGGALHDCKENFFMIAPLRSEYNAFLGQGVACTPYGEDAYKNDKAPFFGAFIVLGKHKKLDGNMLLALLKCVKAGGLVLIVGLNKIGAASFCKKIEKVFSIDGKIHKNHTLSFWFQRPENLPENLEALFLHPPLYFGEAFKTVPGVFSHGKIDKGSLLLSHHLEGHLKGSVADFGAGWGYLTWAALQYYPKSTPPPFTQIDLFEVNAYALACAQENLAGYNFCPINFYWKDLLTESCPQQYDTILCNPPFHEKTDTDLTLGQAFIRQAHQNLKPRGRLLLVCNRHLPYEASLETLFRRVQSLARERHFKVFLAYK